MHGELCGTTVCLPTPCWPLECEGKDFVRPHTRTHTHTCRVALDRSECAQHVTAVHSDHRPRPLRGIKWGGSWGATLRGSRNTCCDPWAHGGHYSSYRVIMSSYWWSMLNRNDGYHLNAGMKMGRRCQNSIPLFASSKSSVKPVQMRSRNVVSFYTNNVATVSAGTEIPIVNRWCTKSSASVLKLHLLLHSLQHEHH